MDKSKTPSRCVHCGKPFVDMPKDPMSRSDDHVFPTSWFPDSTPETVQRWTVPSHLKCNNDLGTLESDLFIRLAFCTDRRKIEASGLSQKALAALGIGVSGLTPKEERHRLARKAKLLKQINPKGWSGLNVLPGLGPHKGFPYQLHQSIEIPPASLLAVTEKIVRGCEYKMNGDRIIDPPYEVSVHFVEEQEVPDIIRTFAPLGPLTLGPGFWIQRAAVQDDPLSALYRISIWDTLKFFAAILPTE